MTPPLCLKIGYASEDAAQRALEDVRHERRRRNKRGHIERRVYLHSECGFWHLTSLKAQP